MRRTLMSRASPVGVGNDVVPVRDHRDHVARLLVFGRRLVRAKASVVRGRCLRGRRVGSCRERDHKGTANDLSRGKYGLSTTGGDAPKFSYAIVQPGHRGTSFWSNRGAHVLAVGDETL